MKNLKDFFSTPLKLHILLLSGIGIIISYLYFILVLKRPLRNIPFNLTLWAFFSLVIIIVIQLYLIYKWFRPSSSQLIVEFIKKYLFWVLGSLALVDDGLKSLTLIRKIYHKVIHFVIHNIAVINSVFAMLILIPRILLCSIFFIDVFYFHSIYFQ